jgi:hypothetical protein
MVVFLVFWKYFEKIDAVLPSLPSCKTMEVYDTEN